VSSTLTFDDRFAAQDIGCIVRSVDPAELTEIAAAAAGHGLFATDAQTILATARRENDLEYDDEDVETLSRMIVGATAQLRAEREASTDWSAAHRLAEYEADPDGQERRWRADERD